MINQKELTDDQKKQLEDLKKEFMKSSFKRFVNSMFTFALLLIGNTIVNGIIFKSEKVFGFLNMGALIISMVMTVMESKKNIKEIEEKIKKILGQ